ncbi:unnamed protein product [Ceratitis capitata]|uniref:(Mediterranean fruit fly) hypothetical protein n=1 Tax=Ceratitis capitata TaxID=7213 RepID=A0A811U1V1_CERCA|nr:unnamed protein product [Ceratitis capitata]
MYILVPKCITPWHPKSTCQRNELEMVSAIFTATAMKHCTHTSIPYISMCEYCCSNCFKKPTASRKTQVVRYKPPNPQTKSLKGSFHISVHIRVCTYTYLRPLILIDCAAFKSGVWSGT